MATNGTWVGSLLEYEDFENANNWLDGIVAAGDGATITIALPTGHETWIPINHRPTTGMFNFVVQNCSAAVGSWLDGASVGNVTLDAGILADTTLNIDGPAGLTGTGNVGTGAQITYSGIVNVDATWNVGPGSTFLCDLPGTLNLGSTTANLAISIQAATTVAVSQNTGASDWTIANGQTLTLNDGVTITCGTITAAGGAGVLALAANATATVAGNMTAGTGSLLTTAAGKTFTCTGVATGGSISGKYAIYAHGGTVTVGTSASGVGGSPGVAADAGTVTITNALGGAGNSQFAVYALAGCTMTVTNATGGAGVGGAYGIYQYGGTLVLSTATGGNDTAGYGLYMTGGEATVGNVIAATANGVYAAGGTLHVSKTTSGSYVIGPASGTGHAHLDLLAGTHSFSTVARGHADNVGDTLTAAPGATVKFSGDVNFTGIAADLTSSAWFATATGKTITGGASITAAGADIFANSFVLTLLNLGTINARGWNGCTKSGTTDMQNLPGPPEDY